MTSVDGRKVTYKPVSRMLSGEKTKLRTRFQSTVIKKKDHHRINGPVLVNMGRTTPARACSRQHM
jgi:hypothetical protein